MQKSYVILELDTTPPSIQIYAPKYTTNDLLNVITIEANEKLSDYQDIWVVDSNGKRHNYNFSKETDESYIGYVQFTSFPLGVSTIYARLKDEVGNMSELKSFNFVIKESLNKMFVKIRDFQNHSVEVKDKERLVKVKDKSKKVIAKDGDFIG
jgi:hypothetical protein